jgi:hypothetical protein
MPRPRFMSSPIISHSLTEGIINIDYASSLERGMPNLTPEHRECLTRLTEEVHGYVEGWQEHLEDSPWADGASPFSYGSSVGLLIPIMIGWPNHQNQVGLEPAGMFRWMETYGFFFSDNESVVRDFMVEKGELTQEFVDTFRTQPGSLNSMWFLNKTPDERSRFLQIVDDYIQNPTKPPLTFKEMNHFLMIWFMQKWLSGDIM